MFQIYSKTAWQGNRDTKVFNAARSLLIQEVIAQFILRLQVLICHSFEILVHDIHVLDVNRRRISSAEKFLSFLGFFILKQW